MKRKVIIDCDPGIDDALALMLACASDDLDVLGITIVAGNIPAKQCAENALRILKLMGRLDIPVFLGAESPLKRQSVTASEVHSNDGLGGVNLESVTETRYYEDAVGFMTETLTKQNNVSIIAIGPLTNIAHLIQQSSHAAAQVEQLVVMGGAFRTSGNTSPVAEFNFYADPHAAEIVFNQLERPITMVDLDVTRQVILSALHRELLHQLHNPKADFILAITRYYTDFYWQKNHVLGCVIHDPLAVAYFIRPELCHGIDCHVDIVTEGKAEGMCIIDETGITGKRPNCRVLTQVDANSVMHLLFSRLFPANVENIAQAFEYILNYNA